MTSSTHAHLNGRNHANGQGADSAPTRTARPRIPGYTATIVREDVKDQLRTFRQRHGYLHSEHIERCLTSAALQMVLQDPTLQQRLLENLDAAVLEDTRLLRRPEEKGT